MSINRVSWNIIKPVINKPFPHSGVFLPIPDISAMANKMAIGMNGAWPTSWAGSWIYSNLMYTITNFTLTQGSGTFTADRGLLIASDKTNKFRATLADKMDRLPVGTYTILNPDRLKVHVGGWNAPNDNQFNTAAEFTVQVNGGVTALCVHIQGDVTNVNGNLAVIMPDHLESWRAGNVWNSAFLDFYKNAKFPLLRTMDMTSASTNIETDWLDRIRPTDVAFRTYETDTSIVPYEFLCDLAERINVDLWVSVPARATVDYITQMANLFNVHYSKKRKLWLELANEVWNTGVPWGEGTAWIKYLPYTRHTATFSPDRTRLTKANHGLVQGQLVRTFLTRSARMAGQSDWMLTNGIGNYVKVIDTNTFELYSEPAFITRRTPIVGHTDLIYIKDNEAGKVPNLNRYYGELCLRNWAVFDTAMGPDRIKRMVMSWADNKTYTAERMATPGIVDKADAVGIAPYFDGLWCGAKVTSGDGSLTCSYWGSKSGPVAVGIYPAAANPSVNDVLNGVGSLAFNTATYTANAITPTYTTLLTKTGLVNGESYKVHMVFNEGSVYRRLVTSATAALTPVSTFGLSTFDEQKLTNLLSILIKKDMIKDHKALAFDKTIISYEGGLHFHQSAPVEVKAWLATYLESPQFAEVLRRYLNEMATAGCKLFCQYGDALGTTFSLANSFYDVTDLRYLTFKAFQGYVPAIPIQAQPKIANMVIPPVKVRPMTFPHLIKDFGVSTVLSFLSGGESGNFSLSDGKLWLVAEVGIDWEKPKVQDLNIFESSDDLSNAFSVSVTIGDAWYDSDALFALDTTKLVNTASLVPQLGAAMALGNASPQASLVDGMVNMTDAWYLGATVSKDVISLAKPMFIAFVMDHNAAPKYGRVITVGSGNFIGWTAQGGDFVISANIAAKSIPSLTHAGKTSPGKKVFWVYYAADGTNNLVCGINQVTGASVTTQWNSGDNISRNLAFGNTGNVAPNNSNNKHGSFCIMNRTGFTLADGKALVAKMQALHNIL